MQTRHLIAGLVMIASVASAPAVFADQAGGQSGSKAVRGKVIGVAKDTVVIRQDASQAQKEISLIVDPERARDVAVGDSVEAQIDGSGRASSFRKTGGAQQGGGIGSSGEEKQSLSDQPAR
jgi:hypothetical protein